MTTTEKFLTKENGAKDSVIAVLKIFDGKSYKFANATLNTVKNFLNEESQFSAKNALKKIENMTTAEVAPKPKKK